MLPFSNLSDSADSYLSNGITDEIITDLARFRSLFVVARNSSFAFQLQPVDLAEVSRRLGVFPHPGKRAPGGDCLRITAQLVKAGTGIDLWTGRYDRHLDDVFAVQDEVAQMIASTLFRRIEDARLEQALRKPTDSMEAYDCFLRGLAHFRRFAKNSNQPAGAMLERAVALDPQFALAQAYLALVRCAIAGYAAASLAVLEAAFAMASQAIDLHPQESRCHRMLGQICLYQRDYDAAERHLSRTRELNPNDADGTHQMGFLLAVRGSPEEALHVVTS